MIIIAPWSRQLRNGGLNPKNYPYWPELASMLPGKVVQVGTSGETKLVEDMRVNLSISELKALIDDCVTWISVDTFFQHLAWKYRKKGIVLWGPSDPIIYGHPENINLLADRKYLVDNQFLNWEQYQYDPERFVKPEVVIKSLSVFFT